MGNIDIPKRFKKEPIQIRIFKFSPIHIETNYPKDYFLFAGEKVEIILPPIIVSSKLIGRKEDARLPDIKIIMNIIEGWEQTLEHLISSWLMDKVVMKGLEDHWKKRKFEIKTGLQIPEKPK